jgi:hypothetical protein
MFFLFLLLGDPWLAQSTLEDYQIFHLRFGTATDASHAFLVGVDRIVKVGAQGELLGTFSQVGPGPLEMAGPGPVGVDGDRLYLYDLKGQKLLMLNHDLLPLASMPFARFGSTLGIPLIKDRQLKISELQTSWQDASLSTLQVKTFDLEPLQERATYVLGHYPPRVLFLLGVLAFGERGDLFATEQMTEGLNIRLLKLAGKAGGINREWRLQLPILPPHGVEPSRPAQSANGQLPAGPLAILAVHRMAELHGKWLFFLSYQYMASPGKGTVFQNYLVVARVGGSWEVLDVARLDGQVLLSLDTLTKQFLFYRSEESLSQAELAKAGRPGPGLYRLTLEELLANR